MEEAFFDQQRLARYIGITPRTVLKNYAVVPEKHLG